MSNAKFSCADSGACGALNYSFNVRASRLCLFTFHSADLDQWFYDKERGSQKMNGL
jgi:hypothetical protein